MFLFDACRVCINAFAYHCFIFVRLTSNAGSKDENCRAAKEEAGSKKKVVKRCAEERRVLRCGCGQGEVGLGVCLRMKVLICTCVLFRGLLLFLYFMGGGDV